MDYGLFYHKLFYNTKKKKYETFFWDSFDFWQRKFMFEIAQFWQEVSKRLGSIFEQWTKLHFKLNLERTLMHEPLVCKRTERISLSLCTWSQMVKSLLPIFLLSYTFLAIFSLTICSSFIKLRFRQSFRGADRV